jgi:hypothetical protein
VSVALVIQLTKRMHNITYIIICGVCGCTVLSHIISQREKRCSEKVIENKMCDLLSSVTIV